MRSFHVGVMLVGLAVWTPQWSSAQDGDRQSSGSGANAAGKTVTATTAAGETYTVTTQEKPGAKPRPELATEVPSGRWVRALTNVQIELTITDQVAGGAADKKTVSMVVSSGSWGKTRSVAFVREAGRDQAIELNVDARPFVSVDGPIQLELTVIYSPPGAQTGDVVRVRPTGVNQSLTVVLHSGKPLVISQASDPVGDRRIIVEAKATVLK